MNEKDSVVPFLNKKAELVWDWITKTETWSAKDNGGFLHTCMSHCDGCLNWSGEGWDGVRVGSITVKDAVTKWYKGDSVRTPTQCLYSEVPPYQCNPTCPPFPKFFHSTIMS